LKSNFFEGIFTLIDKSLDAFIIDKAALPIDFITPVFSSMMIVWVVLWGYMMLFGKTSEPLQEGVFRIVRVGIIMTLGLTISTYTDVVVRFFAEGPASIAAIITGSPTGTSAQAIDQLFLEVFKVAEVAWEKGGVMNGNFGMYIICVIHRHGFN